MNHFRNAYTSVRLFVALIPVVFVAIVLSTECQWQDGAIAPTAPLNDLTFYLDSLVLQGISGVLASLGLGALLTYRWPERFRGWKAVAASAALCLCLLVLSFLAEHLILKPAFAVDRPTINAGETFLLKHVVETQSKMKVHRQDLYLGR